MNKSDILYNSLIVVIVALSCTTLFLCIALYKESDSSVMLLESIDDKIEDAIDECAPLCKDDEEYNFWKELRETVIDKIGETSENF